MCVVERFGAEGLPLSVPIDPGQYPQCLTLHHRLIDQGSVIRLIKLRGPKISLGNSFDQRHGASRDGPLLDVERLSQQGAVQHMHHVSGGQIPHVVAAVLNQHVPFTRDQRLDRDSSAGKLREQQPFPAWKELWPNKINLAPLHWDDDLRRTPGPWDPQHAKARRAEENGVVGTPACTEERGGLTEHYRRPLPVTDTFFNWPSAQNAIHSPSGEKKGSVAPSVRAIGVASIWSIARR